MILKLTDKNKLEEEELNDILQNYWEQNKTVEELWINKKCENYIKNHWIMERAIYKTCECCGQTTKEIDHFEKIKPWKNASNLIYESDFMLTKIKVV